MFVISSSPPHVYLSMSISYLCLWIFIHIYIYCLVTAVNDSKKEIVKNSNANNQSHLNSYFFKSFNKLLSHASCRSRILILIHKNRNEIRLSLKDFRSNLHLSLLLIRTNDRLSHVDFFTDKFITISLFMRSLPVINGYVSIGTMLIFWDTMSGYINLPWNVL